MFAPATAGRLSCWCIPKDKGAIYNKYLTHEEIKGLLVFYKSELGQKAIDVMPKMTSEAIVLGQAWGQGLGPELVQRLQAALKKEGIELPNN
jgi:uncharacterized protein